MKSRIVQIGNSRGVRLPKVLLEQAQLADEVELDAEPSRIVIRRGSRPRAGWAAAARKMHERGEAVRLTPPLRPVRRERLEMAIGTRRAIAR